MFFDIIIME